MLSDVAGINRVGNLHPPSMSSVKIIYLAFEITYDLEVTSDMLVRDLKAQVAELVDLPVGNQRLSIATRILKDDESITGRSTVYLSRIDSDLRSIYITTLRGKTLIYKDWNSDHDTVLTLKQYIEDLTGVLHEQQRLFFFAKPLEDHCKLSQYNIFNEAVLNLVLRLRGGGPGSGGSGPRMMKLGLAFAGVCQKWDGDMHASNTTGLTLSIGQVVVIVEAIDDHWFRGRHPEEYKEGVFPSAFVRVLEYSDQGFQDAMRSGLSQFKPKYAPPAKEVRAAEAKHAEELKTREVTLKTDPIVPPFTYPEIETMDFRFPLPHKSFVYVSVECPSKITPGDVVEVKVTPYCNTHDSHFVSSLHLTIESPPNKVLTIHPKSQTDPGKHIEMDVKNVTGTENNWGVTGTFGLAVQPVTLNLQGTKGGKSSNSLELSGKEAIGAEISGQIQNEKKSAFWLVKSEITPSKLRGLSGLVWEGMSFTLDKYPSAFRYKVSVNFKAQDGKERTISGRFLNWFY